MNAQQRFVFWLGAVLLFLTVTFPYTRYTATKESSRDPAEFNLNGLPEGSSVKHIDFTTRTGFRPIWQSADPLRLDTNPSITFGLGIRWPVVLGMAVAIIIGCGVGIRLLRGRSTAGVK